MAKVSTEDKTPAHPEWNQQWSNPLEIIHQNNFLRFPHYSNNNLLPSIPRNPTIWPISARQTHSCFPLSPLFLMSNSLSRTLLCNLVCSGGYRLLWEVAQLWLKKKLLLVAKSHPKRVRVWKVNGEIDLESREEVRRNVQIAFLTVIPRQNTPPHISFITQRTS